jgi:hypothetical protein
MQQLVIIQQAVHCVLSEHIPIQKVQQAVYRVKQELMRGQLVLQVVRCVVMASIPLRVPEVVLIAQQV